jgi:hypothetical protein
LDDLVFERRYTYRALLAVGFGYPNSLARLRLILFALYTIMEAGKMCFEILPVLLPRNFVYSGCCVSLEREI